MWTHLQHKISKTKITSYGGKSRDFHDNETPKVGSNCTCLVVILIDFVLKKIWKPLPASFFEKTLNILKKKKIWFRYVTDDREISSENSEKD